MEFEITLDIDPAELEGIVENIQDVLDGTGEYGPHTIAVESDHAVYIEFGTGPASGKKSQTTDVRKEIDLWVRDKLKITDPAKRSEASQRIYKKIMRSGIPPQPYLRPAVHRVTDNLDEDFIANGGTVKDIADMVVEEMQRILEENDTIYKGDISRNIRVYEGDRTVSGGVQDRIRQEVWDSDDLGYDGVKRARKRR